jgi:hypothetical protein
MRLARCTSGTSGHAGERPSLDGRCMVAPPLLRSYLCSLRARRRSMKAEYRDIEKQNTQKMKPAKT